MTVAEALEHFDRFPRVKRILGTLDATGLGYIRLGQPATTLSGGEAQRIKLASELARRSTGKTSTFSTSPPPAQLQASTTSSTCSSASPTRQHGRRHRAPLDVIKSADHVIDLGPTAATAGAS